MKMWSYPVWRPLVAREKAKYIKMDEDDDENETKSFFLLLLFLGICTLSL